MSFNSSYVKGTRLIKKSGGVTKTEQSHAKELDVNFIMKRFQKTGQLPDPGSVSPQFMDVTGVTDFQDMHNRVVSAREAFERVPAEERAKYGNDPMKWIEGKYQEVKDAKAKKAHEDLIKAKDEEIAAAKAANKEKGA